MKDAQLISKQWRELRQAAKFLKSKGLEVQEWQVLRAIQELHTNVRTDIYKHFGYTPDK